MFVSMSSAKRKAQTGPVPSAKLNSRFDASANGDIVHRESGVMIGYLQQKPKWNASKSECGCNLINFRTASITPQDHKTLHKASAGAKVLVPCLQGEMSNKAGAKNKKESAHCFIIWCSECERYFPKGTYSNANSHPCRNKSSGAGKLDVSREDFGTLMGSSSEYKGYDTATTLEENASTVGSHGNDEFLMYIDEGGQQSYGHKDGVNVVSDDWIEADQDELLVSELLHTSTDPVICQPGGVAGLDIARKSNPPGAETPMDTDGIRKCLSENLIPMLRPLVQEHPEIKYYYDSLQADLSVNMSHLFDFATLEASQNPNAGGGDVAYFFRRADDCKPFSTGEVVGYYAEDKVIRQSTEGATLVLVVSDNVAKWKGNIDSTAPDPANGHWCAWIGQVWVRVSEAVPAGCPVVAGKDGCGRMGTSASDRCVGIALEDSVHGYVKAGVSFTFSASPIPTGQRLKSIVKQPLSRRAGRRITLLCMSVLAAAFVVALVNTAVSVHLNSVIDERVLAERIEEAKRLRLDAAAKMSVGDRIQEAQKFYVLQLQAYRQSTASENAPEGKTVVDAFVNNVLDMCDMASRLQEMNNGKPSSWTSEPAKVALSWLLNFADTMMATQEAVTNSSNGRANMDYWVGVLIPLFAEQGLAASAQYQKIVRAAVVAAHESPSPNGGDDSRIQCTVLESVRGAVCGHTARRIMELVKKLDDLEKLADAEPGVATDARRTIRKAEAFLHRQELPGLESFMDMHCIKDSPCTPEDDRSLHLHRLSEDFTQGPHEHTTSIDPSAFLTGRVFLSDKTTLTAAAGLAVTLAGMFAMVKRG